MGTASDAFDPLVFLAKVGSGKTISKYPKNKLVYSQGDAADTVYYIQEGRVRLTVVSEQGKEAVVGILGPGQFFGEGCLRGHPFRIGTIRAMEKCVITSITKAAMLAVLHDQPRFSELFMAYLLSRNRRIEEDLIDQLFNSSERRLARLLLLLVNFGREGNAVSLNISQELLAEMIGTTRSRVSFFMNKFRKLGFITYNGNIEVHNSLLDAVLREKGPIDGDMGTTNLRASGRCWRQFAEQHRLSSLRVMTATMACSSPRIAPVSPRAQREWQNTSRPTCRPRARCRSRRWTSSAPMRGGFTKAWGLDRALQPL